MRFTNIPTITIVIKVIFIIYTFIVIFILKNYSNIQKLINKNDHMKISLRIKHHERNFDYFFRTYSMSNIPNAKTASCKSPNRKIESASVPGKSAQISATYLQTKTHSHIHTGGKTHMHFGVFTSIIHPGPRKYFVTFYLPGKSAEHVAKGDSRL